MPRNPHAQPIAPSRAGFTLIELLVVVGIAALLLTMASTAFFGAQRTESLTKSRNQLRDVLLSARQQACIMGKTFVVICYNVDQEFDVGSTTQKGKQGRYALFQYVGRAWPSGRRLAAPFGVQRDVLGTIRVNERLINIDDAENDSFMRVENVVNDDTLTAEDAADENSGNRVDSLDYEYYDGEKLKMTASEDLDYNGNKNLGFFVAELRDSNGVPSKPFPLGVRVTSTYSLPRMYSFGSDRTAFIFTPDGRVENAGAISASLAFSSEAPSFSINVDADGTVKVREN